MIVNCVWAGFRGQLIPTKNVSPILGIIVPGTYDEGHWDRALITDWEWVWYGSIGSIRNHIICNFLAVPFTLKPRLVLNFPLNSPFYLNPFLIMFSL
jgi:hypothetical protein